MNDQRVPLRQRRDLSRIIGDAFTLYLRNFYPLFSIAALVIPGGVAIAVFQTAVNDRGVGVLALLLGLLLQAAANLLATAGLIAALADIDAGRAPDFGRAYDLAFGRFWTLAGAVLRVAFHVALFAITIVGIPWAIQRGVRWLFVEQAVILDSTSAKAALTYSADAVIGSWWRTAGIAIIISVIGAVPRSLTGGVVAFAPVLVSGTVNAVVNALVLPFVVVALTLLYFDLSARKESHGVADTA